jgi:hypothetical protein
VNVGTIVKLKVRNPIWDRREAYAYPIAQFEVYTGTVLPSPTWVGADAICLATGDVRFPFRVIEKARIEGYSQGPASPKALQTAWTVPGGKPGQTYLVTREGSRWGCNCVGFGYRRACSHVVIAKAEFEGVANSLNSKEKKNYKKSKKNACVIPRNEVECKSKVMNRGNPAPYIMMRSKMSKRSQAIEIMKANSDKEMSFVVKLIAAKIGVSEGNAKSYYRYIVANNLASGNVTKTVKAKAPKAAKVAKAPKPAKAKLEKSVRAINSAHKAKVELNVDEIAKIKEANLARMREVSEKLKPKGKVRDYGTRVAAPEGEGVSDFDPTLAREEVNAILRDERLIDVCPKFIRDGF